MRNALLLIEVQKIYTTPGLPLFIEGHDVAIANMRGGTTLWSMCAMCTGRTVAMPAACSTISVPPGEIGFLENSEEIELDPALTLSPGALQITKSRY